MDDAVRAHTGAHSSTATQSCEVPDDGGRVWEWAAEPGADDEALALLGHVAGLSGPFFGVYITPQDPLFALLRPLGPVDVSPEPGPLMVRAANLDVLRPVLTDLLAGLGGQLAEVAGEPVLSVDQVRLTSSWSRLLSLVYDGRQLDEQLDGGLLHLTPDEPAAREAMAELLPPRVASRRPTDAF